eukprot:s288_g28.t1
MRWSERKRADWGNVMADFTFKAFRLQVVEVNGMALFENPEDLGAVKSGENRGIRPASMWQWPEFETLVQLDQVSTVAFYQQDFGTDYLKPTRLLLGNLRKAHDSFHWGVPTFDDQGAATRQLVGSTGSSFATTGSEQWPSNMRGRCFLRLGGVPREFNQLADDLANLKFDSFEMKSRVHWDPAAQQWHVLDDFMKHAREFHEEMKSRKAEELPPEPQKRRKVSKLDPW